MTRSLPSTEEFLAAVADGSLAAEINAGVDPAWEARYGAASWQAALEAFGYGKPPRRKAAKYSDDQPRDEGGRWTSGGGGGGAAAPSPADAATESAGRLASGVRSRAEAAEPDISATLQEVTGGRTVPYSVALEGGPAPAGGDLAGFENRLKTEGSLTRKIRDEAAERGVSQEEAATGIGDSVRYTVRLNEGEYREGAERTRDALIARGYTAVKWKTSWEEDAEYKGLNSNFIAPNGTKFEVQFHTPSSFRMKEVNHQDYEAWRTSSDAGERDRLTTRMKERAGGVSAPPGWRMLAAWSP